ncbi:MAG: rubredoxin [Clostridium sp.]|nr:rubredoxin [Clostridium sp.]
MKKYLCTICGYIYDEAIGNPEGGISQGTKWEDVLYSWVCPLCGASKGDFKENEISSQPFVQDLDTIENDMSEMRELSFGEMSALCSNLSKGCEKQYRVEEAELFNQLSEYYKNKRGPVDEKQLKDLAELIEHDLNTDFTKANNIANKLGDRGTLRALTWGEKVTRMINSLLSRYEKQQDSLLENTNVYVCEICGFIYIGDDVLEICPVCKVPKMKITEIKRG